MLIKAHSSTGPTTDADQGKEQYKRQNKHASVQQDKTCSCNGYYTLEIQEALPNIWLDLIRELNVKPALFEKRGFRFPMPPKELGGTYLLQLVPIGFEVQ